MSELNAPAQLSPKHYYILHVEDQPLQNDYRDVIASCLAAYEMNPSDILWTQVRSRDDAIAVLNEMSERNPKGRGFDAVLCDLQIYGAGEGTPPDIKYGLQVAAEVHRLRCFHHWPTVIIGLTAWNEVSGTLQSKLATEDGFLDGAQKMERSTFDEFLGKSQKGEEEFVAAIKLRRLLVPTSLLAVQARKWEPPCYFEPRMRESLQQLARIARQDVAGWPLPKILLLGESGSGKGMLARSYYQLLEYFNPKPRSARPRQGNRPYVVNCASLVAEGEGGRIRLFGFRSNQRNLTVHPAPGVFERASSYASLSNGFASDNAEPDYSAGGVVFLDEFVTMPEELQAAVLNTLEEGIVHRQDGSNVSIGCHVICATNAEISELQRDVRRDLLDRIPHVVTVPALRERKGEAIALLTEFTKLRLARLKLAKRQASPPTFDVTITASARQIVERAVEIGAIRSVRQLQMIAEVQDGENVISDGNLFSVFQKLRLLNIPADVLTKPTLSFADKASTMGLHRRLQRDDLPLETAAALELVYKLYSGDDVNFKDEFPNHMRDEERRRFHLILRDCFRPAKTQTMLRPMSPVAIRQERSRLGLSRITKQKCIDYLLSNETLEARTAYAGSDKSNVRDA